MFECEEIECSRCKIRHSCDDYKIEIGFEDIEVFEECKNYNKKPNKYINLDYYDNLNY